MISFLAFLLPGGLEFFYTHVLNKPWTDVQLIKPSKAVRISDIVTVEEAQRLFMAISRLSFRVFSSRFIAWA